MWLYARDRVQEDIIFEPIALAEEEAVVTAPPPVVSQTSLTPPVDPTPPNEQQSATIEDQSEDKININTASQSQLESLPGVGPVIAERIIQHRPYSSIFDIQRVPGIGKKRYEQIAERITID